MARKSSYQVVDGIIEFVPTKPTYTKDYMRVVANKVLELNGIPKVCIHCGCDDPDVMEAHHLDGNPHNHRLYNIAYFCGSCHNKRHALERRHAKNIADARKRNQ